MLSFRPATPTSSARTAAIVLVAVVLILALVPAGLLMAPRSLSYRLDPSTLQVEARMGPLDLGRTVERSRVREARPITVRGASRQAGTAVDGFCHGRWSIDEVGVVWMATSCTSEAVLVEIEGEEHPWVLSPVDPAAFLAAIPSGTGSFEAMPSPPASPFLAFAGVFVFALVAGTFGLLLISPARLRFDVGEGSLWVRTAWGTRRVPLEGATLRADPQARPTLRLFGIGMPGHQVGRYRVSGRTAQIYVSDVRKAVWVEPSQGLPVLITPEDVDGFLIAARQAQGAS